MGVGSAGKTDLSVGGIKYAVVALAEKVANIHLDSTPRRENKGKADAQEGVPIDKVKARPRWGSDVADNKVDQSRATSDGNVERTRPDLPISR